MSQNLAEMKGHEAEMEERLTLFSTRNHRHLDAPGAQGLAILKLRNRPLCVAVSQPALFVRNFKRARIGHETGDDAKKTAAGQGLFAPDLLLSVVVGRGVDPRTYRFSGGRSAD
jgi:hypothetical protein